MHERSNKLAQTQEQNSIAVRIDTTSFHTGFVEGLTGQRDGFPVLPVQRSMTEEDIVSIIVNLCEIAQEGWLKDEQVRHDAGMIVGWLYRPNVWVATSGKE
jgi:hypothetical protein